MYPHIYPHTLGNHTLPDTALTHLAAHLFDYTDVRAIFYCIAIDRDCYVGVAGDGDNGSYEWFIWTDGRLEASNCGYGMTEIALRDVLNRVHPPETKGAQP